MKLKLISLVVLLASAFSSFAADLLPQPGSTNTLSLNTTNKANTNTEPPKVLGNSFTNSADMLLIKVSDSWVGEYDVTQKEYQKIMGFNPSAFPGPTRPVDSISWNDAMDFCAKMTEADNKEMLIPAGFYYTLPTEDEWQSLAADTSLDDAVTSLNGDRGGTSPVGSMKPNGLGLYDMRGNVMQWTLGDDSKPYRVLLGGSWQDSIEINLRTAFRFYTPPDTRQNTFGFRCVLKKR
jgi:formylglycine-generating enzyme required for sulfatase activity